MMTMILARCACSPGHPDDEVLRLCNALVRDRLVQPVAHHAKPDVDQHGLHKTAVCGPGGAGVMPLYKGRSTPGGSGEHKSALSTSCKSCQLRWISMLRLEQLRRQVIRAASKRALFNRRVDQCNTSHIRTWWRQCGAIENCPSTRAATAPQRSTSG